MTNKPEKPTRALAIMAKCHDCMGGYLDGRNDCTTTTCPLYSWMRYAAFPPNLDWMNYNPKRAGKVTWEESGREMTDEEREAAAERLRGVHHKKKKTKKHETLYEEELGLSEDEDQDDE